MTSIPVSKRGTITLPPEMRRKLGLDAAEHPMMLVELRDGGIFLQPAEALPVSISALAAQCQVLLTPDKGDFSMLLVTTVYGMRVDTPRDFLISEGIG